MIVIATKIIVVIGIIGSSGISVRIRRQNGTGVGLYACPQLIVLLIESVIRIFR